MSMNLLALSQHSGLRIAEVGFVLSGAAGVALALGAVTPSGRRIARVVAGLALATGSLLLLIATHWGHFH